MKSGLAQTPGQSQPVAFNINQVWDDEKLSACQSQGDISLACPVQ